MAYRFHSFWASNWPTQNAPLPGLLIHLIVTVSKPPVFSFSELLSLRFVFGEVIVIIAPPQKVAYPFILDVSGYPLQIIWLFVVLVKRTSLLTTFDFDLSTGFFLPPLG